MCFYFSYLKITFKSTCKPINYYFLFRSIKFAFKTLDEHCKHIFIVNLAARVQLYNSNV